ncbi:MAG: Alpha,2-mannosidase [Frankiales bacterium]|nr:Alpha,2-mannosidase [Frankiales bacterium]
MRLLLSSVCATALVLTGAVPAMAAAPAVVTDATGYVDPLIGSGGDGFTVPGAATPFGLTQVSPDTINPLAYTGYKYEDAAIRGFSMLHINAAGVPIAADLPFLPVTTPVTDPSDPTRFAVPFSHAGEHAAAGAYDVQLGNGVAVSLAATPHGGLESYTPAPGTTVTVLADIGRNAAGLNESTVSIPAADRLEGSSLVHWRGGDYTAFFSARFSQPAATTQTFVGSAVSPASTAHGTGAGAILTFATGQPVTVKVGVSLVDLDGARSNLAAEIPAYDVAGAQSAARTSWRRELSRIRIGGGSNADLRTFYTSLYRAFLNPDVDSDVDGRYAGADGQIHHSDRLHYENYSLWDTIRGENALLATLVPDRYRDMVASLSTYATESGQLPRWSFHDTHPDYMNGDPAIATVAEAVCRGIADDPETLYQQARHLAFDQRSQADQARGWSGGDAAGTLENADADFALALMARKLGHTDDATVLTARSQSWKNLYHAGFLQPRNADGSWPASYDPMSGTGYREGTGWQYLWLAPHDMGGLQAAYDGDGSGYASRLDHFFSVPVTDGVPGIPVVPQVQSGETGFGTNYYGDQYVPGNEHDLEAPYAYDWSDRPSTGQGVLSSERSLFNDTPYGLPGNDDLGSMAGWYVWAALGIYPPAAGAPMFVVGTPLFPRAEIDLGGAAPFVIDAPSASAQAPYISAATLDGQPLTRTWMGAEALHPGGQLHFDMGSTASAWGAGAAAHPPSVSSAGLSPFGCEAAAAPGPDVPEFPAAPIALIAAALLLGTAAVRRAR